jgi:hypothetical protein
LIDVISMNIKGTSAAAIEPHTTRRPAARTGQLAADFDMA